MEYKIYKNLCSRWKQIYTRIQKSNAKGRYNRIGRAGSRYKINTGVKQNDYKAREGGGEGGDLMHNNRQIYMNRACKNVTKEECNDLIGVF